MIERTLDEKKGYWESPDRDATRARNMKDAREFGADVVCAWCGMSEADDPDMHDTLCPSPDIQKANDEWLAGVIEKIQSGELKQGGADDDAE